MDNISLNDFLKLSFKEQIEKASKGEFLDDRDAGPYIVLLFNVGSFYAEIFYHDKKCKVSHIKLYKTVRVLEPYLEKVVIEELF